MSLPPVPGSTVAPDSEVICGSEPQPVIVWFELYAVPKKKAFMNSLRSFSSSCRLRSARGMSWKVAYQRLDSISLANISL
jgi:hypothetical protein